MLRKFRGSHAWSSRKGVTNSNQKLYAPITPLNPWAFEPDSSSGLIEDPIGCIPCEHADSTIDVAVLPFMTPRSEWPMAWDESFFDETKNQRSIGLRVTQTCFVIGFPLGLVDLTTPAHVLPIYKTANIASEPHLDFQGRPIVIIDVTTRSGMSGSPVVVSQEYQGSLRNRFVGVYTGRFAAVDDIEDPSLGIVYKPKVIQEIFSALQ
jgi:hypothetical protein